MADLLREVRRRFDFCLLDAPAGLGRGFQLATCAADRCVVVTTADASSLRDAQHTVMELDRFPAGALHLVVNRVRKKLLRQLHATIDDAIDKAGLPLLGVVPEDDALPLCMNRGVPILLADGQSAATAYRNIAKRLQGERVPLLRIRIEKGVFHEHRPDVPRQQEGADGAVLHRLLPASCPTTTFTPPTPLATWWPTPRA